MVFDKIYESFERTRPLRRLSAEEEELLGYAGPLVLHRVTGVVRVPWPRPRYRIHQHGYGFVLDLSARELAKKGIDPAR